MLTTKIARALGHTPQEYESLRAQARSWENATDRILGQATWATGAGCPGASGRQARQAR